MQDTAQSVRAVRFGLFELDMRSGELRKNGLKVKLQEQPFQVLSLLLDHPGEVVTREEMRTKLWPEDTFVDFEHSLATDINKLREALGDTVQSPRFIETLPRRGYRFIAPVEFLTHTSSNAVKVEKEIEETRPQHSEKAQHGGPVDDPPDVPANHESPPQQITTGGYTRRAVAAVVQGALEEHRARVRWRRWAVAGLTLTGLGAVLALVVGLNVGGLRDRVSRALGAVHEPPLQIKSIAVLPLENLSRDPEQEYFADGMTDELTATLAKVGSLKIISRTSAMQYKRTNKPLPQIARELNVDAILEGSVLRSGDRVRITAQLIYGPSDRHLWAETYESDLRDILSLQSEVALSITHAVQIKLTPDEQVRLASARPVNPEAHEAYLKGQFFFNKLTKADLRKAIEYAQQAIKIDPDYAPAYGLLASSYFEIRESGFGDLPNREAGQKTRAAAMKALELDDSLADAHVGLGSVLLGIDWDWAGAERELKRAIDLNPSFGRAHAMYAWHLAIVGRTDDSIQEAKRAMELDPISAYSYLTLSAMYFGAGDYNQSIDQSRRWLAMFPETNGPYSFLAYAFEAKGMYDESVAARKRWMALAGAKTEEIAAFERSYKVGGIRGAWRWRIQKSKDGEAAGGEGVLGVAILHTLLGDKDKAFEWLEKGYRQRSQSLCYIQWHHFAIDSLRSDPRFQDLLRRMNFPP